MSTKPKRTKAMIEVAAQVAPPTDTQLAFDAGAVTTVDVPKLSALLQKIHHRTNKKQPTDQLIAQFSRQLQQSQQRVQKNRSVLPTPQKADDLPVTQRWDEIATTIANNQVTIVCGHTGSGKTTKLPQICLAVGLGARGKIAHTQPRRLAARSVSARIAEELNVPLGDAVGYKVRFDEKRSSRTQVLLQTDGMLLAEIQQDKTLSCYEVIIVDEAHERSLNIDFLLGFLKQLLPKRPDLKVIITSATIDPKRFATHFNQAPIVMVEGKAYPVETCYMPPSEQAAGELSEAVCQAITAIDEIQYGDTLVFLPTERDIRDTADALAKLRLKNTQVLSLFSRQSPAEQNAIFHPKSKRRIILATNVAETSVTVPRIINVIDTGLARMSRYSHRSKIQRLPIEPISQASADQRKGRCGRIAPGVCLRLYDEADFNQRPPFTDPEIKRTSLASVILQMTALGLGDIRHFPFVEPPEHKMIRDGYKLLHELTAVDQAHQITDCGKQMAKLSIDPRFARVLLYAKQHAALAECLPIIGGLAVGDIKLRPMGEEAQADQIHRYLTHNQSDFLFFVSVFNTLYPIYQQSKNKARQWMKKHYLSVVRCREWLSLCEQLASDLDYQITLTNPTENKEAHPVAHPVEMDMGQYRATHSALLTGFLDHLGSYQTETQQYLGARNKQFAIFPGSRLFKKRYPQIMAAEIVESSRVYARQVAKIDFAWAAPLAKHLTKSQVADPYWRKKQGNVMAKKTILLYGLPLVKDLLVAYGRTHPEAARDIFIRHALVENAINTRVPAIQANRDTYDKLLALEDKSRSRDIVIDESQFAALYEAVIPAEVYATSGLEAWYSQLPDKHRLVFPERDFRLTQAQPIAEQAYPNTLSIRGQRLKLTYEFSPGSERDGVTIALPLASLNSFSSHDFDYLVPAMLAEKVTALIKSLPKQYRRQFVPVNPFVERILQALETLAPMECPPMERPPMERPPIIEFIMAQLSQLTSIQLQPSLFALDKLAPHHFMNIAIVDKQGNVIEESRNFNELQTRYQQKASADFKARSASVFTEIFTQTFPSQIPTTYALNEKKVVAYPALIETEAGFKIQLIDNEQMAETAHEQGVKAFLKKQLNKEIVYLKKRVFNDTQLALGYRAVGEGATLTEDMVNALLGQYLSAQNLPRNRRDFDSLQTHISANLVADASRLLATVQGIIHAYQTALGELNQDLVCYDPVKTQLARLVFPGFIAATAPTRLPDIARYVKGAVVRLNKCRLDPRRDNAWQQRLDPYLSRLAAQLSDNRIAQTLPPAVQDFAYLIEEFRLSLFAQGDVPVVGKVSEKRLTQSQAQLDKP
ncbi:ATP-dependent RNA helicase HrpA [Ostreibacterium oceani]|uniref:ATP-dependent RNA helicase HrpA n=1 Tax=Ostreibacterium oceani TaxID=2654998 RepID=A0A6N7F1T1_9GAMM|nr:ATP-dependent RNA helicase HrpA [Ostreibacterium oceani]MPV85816.1 ATP-dependent RNA helicase HrpA [Ostreibacterium oceani]